MHDPLPLTARWLGVASGMAVAVLGLAYVCVLAIGLVTLPSPTHQIQQPWLSVMEILIIGMSPCMVALTVALHARAPKECKSLAVASVAFMSMSAVITCAVHFAILTLASQPVFAAQPWTRLVFSFQWPSIAYALDILAWDFFFPLAALFAALTIQGTGRTRWVRGLLFTSAGLSFSGLAGVVLADMQVRNVGIIGYAVLFPIAAAALANLFRRGGGASAA